MRKIEIAAIGVLFGAVPIIICFLAGWWISIPFVPESLIYLFALTGFVVGVLVDLVFLKTWIRNAYSMQPIVWMIIYLFYSVGMFGFFMGVPVFNIALAHTGRFFCRGMAGSYPGRLFSDEEDSETICFIYYECPRTYLYSICYNCSY